MRRFTIVWLVWLAANCNAADPSTLLFRSGFEPDSATVPSKDPRRIKGVDHSVKPPNDWSKNLSVPNPGGFVIQYQGGTPKDRIARIVTDPTDPDNRVLHFWLKNPNVSIKKKNEKKGRIQANIYKNRNIYQMRQRCRVFLPKKDFEILRKWPEKFGWLTLAEFWNEPSWVGSDYPFRISINITKSQGAGKPFVFGIHGQTKPKDNWQSIWDDHNSDFHIPVGEWLTLTYVFIEGGKNTGRLLFTVERENGEKHTIFDIHDCTRHPDQSSPNGLTSWNPLKLYTSQSTVDWVRNNGGTLQVYWDDLELHVNTNRPESKQVREAQE